jgi:predicted DNA-binding WGR domain protein
MPTRSFVIEEAGKKRFWDVTWDGGEVEITSGAWGTNGRARTQSFASAASRDAFIEAEVRKVVKKGFTETNTVAPVTDAPDTGTGRKVAAWRSRFEALAAPAWLPQFGDGPTLHGRVRGPMTLSPGESWPACPSCKRPLSAVLELDRSRLPDPGLRAQGLVQLFTCEAWTNEEATSAACIFDGWLARSHDPSGVLQKGPSLHGKPTLITGWTQFLELPPELDRVLDDELEAEEPEVLEALLQTVGAEDTGRSLYRTWAEGSGQAARNVHKLGGFATFVQECPVTYTRQLFQLECNGPLDLNLGDVGAGHLLLTPSGAVKFYWASH